MEAFDHVISHVITRAISIGDSHEGELEAVAGGAGDGPDTLHVGRVGIRVVRTVKGPCLHEQVPSTA